jgi:hypothetical protein
MSRTKRNISVIAYRHEEEYHLINECASMQASDLATSHIRHLEICVQQQVEAECELLAWVVHTYVEVQLFLS